MFEKKNWKNDLLDRGWETSEAFSCTFLIVDILMAFGIIGVCYYYFNYGMEISTYAGLEVGLIGGLILFFFGYIKTKDRIEIWYISDMNSHHRKCSNNNIQDKTITINHPIFKQIFYDMKLYLNKNNLMLESERNVIKTINNLFDDDRNTRFILIKDMNIIVKVIAHPEISSQSKIINSILIEKKDPFKKTNPEEFKKIAQYIADFWNKKGDRIRP